MNLDTFFKVFLAVDIRINARIASMALHFAIKHIKYA